MVDFNEIAIADLLIYPKRGVVSHQPVFAEERSDKIRVADEYGNYFYVLASECRWPLENEGMNYWENFESGIKSITKKPSIL